MASVKSNWKEKAENRRRNEWLEYSSEIARRILSAIEDNNDLNQAKLAGALGVSPQQISKIIKGQENLTLESIYKISKALNIKLITFPEYKYSKWHKPSLNFEFQDNVVEKERNRIINIFPTKDYADNKKAIVRTLNDFYYIDSAQK